jgi:hypothetical protein
MAWGSFPIFKREAAETMICTLACSANLTKIEDLWREMDE